MSETAITPLADEFAKPDRDMWLKLVEKALKGGDFEKRLVSRTSDGLRIEPLYTRADVVAGAETAVPGSAPFVRGLHADPADLGWSIEQVVVADTAPTANKNVLAELEGGASGVILKIQSPGQVGIPVSSAADMARVLSGVHLDLAPITLAAGSGAADAARHLREAIAILAAPANKVQVNFDLDPIGTLALTGHATTSAAQDVTDAIALAKELRSQFLKSRTVRIDGRVAHEAGASEGQELAVMAASLVTYLRAFESAGVSIADALAQMNVTLAADTDLFLTVAKLRAARRIIARIAQASGAPQAASAIRLSVTSSARMMTKRDPWNNMLRTTAATLGAAFGGADAITVLPYTWALGQPDAFAYRIARNTQIVAQEESSLGRVADPAGGSWYVENLTADLAANAWERFQGIEKAGGILKCLEDGAIQREVAATAATRDTAIATGKQLLTGTSAFPLLGDDGITVTPWPKAPGITGKSIAAPLAPHRLSAPFEELRDAADRATERAGQTPTVFLASLGTIADHTARTTWVKNQLAVAGIASLVSDGFPNAEVAASAFSASDTRTACVCSSDAIYAEQGVEAVKALIKAGAERILFAGRPGELEAELRRAGVNNFLYAGQNSIELLTELQHALTK